MTAQHTDFRTAESDTGHRKRLLDALSEGKCVCVGTRQLLCNINTRGLFYSNLADLMVEFQGTPPFTQRKAVQTDQTGPVSS